MPRIQEYTASGDFRGSDKGIAAYDTMGRRVAGQYDAAASDMTQAGRVTAQSAMMIGRWPFNIIKLMNSGQAGRGAQPGTGPSGVSVKTVGGNSNITDGQFAPRHMPDLNALNQLSEGMGRLGQGASQTAAQLRQQAQDLAKYGYRAPGSQYGNLTDLRNQREYENSIEDAKQAIEDRRAQQLSDAAYQKHWDNYEKNLADYNNKLEAWGNQPAGSPVGTSNDPNSSYYGPNSSPSGSDYGGTAPPTDQDYGGSGGLGFFGSIANGAGLLGSDLASGFSVDQSANSGAY